MKLGLVGLLLLGACAKPALPQTAPLVPPSIYLLREDVPGESKLCVARNPWLLSGEVVCVSVDDFRAWLRGRESL